MTYKRHIDFYLPVLKTLEDLKEHEINTLIEETAKYCKLTQEERTERTRKGSQFKYASNIQWAIQDLSQGGFIERASRGVYKIAFDGLLMLEDNPASPNRDYLEARSEKFKEFRYRKGNRNKYVDTNEDNLFSNLSEEDIEKDIKPASPIQTISEEEIRSNAMDLIEKYITLKRAKEALKMNTEVEEATIKMLQENLLKRLLIGDIDEFSAKLSNRAESGYALLFDCFESNYPKVYWITNNDELKKLAHSSLVYARTDRKNEAQTKNPLSEPSRPRKEKIAPRRIKVVFGDGTLIDDKYAANVFVKTIEKIGTSKIQKLGMVVAGFPLVGEKAPDKYQYKVIEGKYFVPVNSSTETKKRLLEEIAKAFDIKISVEMY